MFQFSRGLHIANNVSRPAANATTKNCQECSFVFWNSPCIDKRIQSAIQKDEFVRCIKKKPKTAGSLCERRSQKEYVLCNVLRQKSNEKRDKNQKKSGHHFTFSSPVNHVDFLSLISQISYLIVVQAKSTVCLPVYHWQDDKWNRHMNVAIQNNNQLLILPSNQDLRKEENKSKQRR